jgi:hypothetical protein
MKISKALEEKFRESFAREKWGSGEARRHLGRLITAARKYRDDDDGRFFTYHLVKRTKADNLYKKILELIDGSPLILVNKKTRERHQISWREDLMIEESLQEIRKVVEATVADLSGRGSCNLGRPVDVLSLASVCSDLKKSLQPGQPTSDSEFSRLLVCFLGYNKIAVPEKLQETIRKALFDSEAPAQDARAEPVPAFVKKFSAAFKKRKK